MEWCFGILYGVVMALNCVKFVIKVGIFGCLKAVKNRVSSWQKLGLKPRFLVSVQQAPRGCCSAAGPVRGHTPRGLRRRCGALRAQALRG